MEDNFKQKMQEIANQKKEAQDAMVDPKVLMDEMRVKSENNKGVFKSVKNDSIYPIVQELNKIFKVAGDSFILFDNEQATALTDQIKTFCQIFYYPKGRSKDKVGLSTPSLYFECLPELGEVKISQNISLRPSPRQLIEKLNIGEFNEDIIEKYVSEFVSQVTNN
ncbi:MAG: hypothetical protein DA405_10450 [Bacteroidetes bacterium]|nr:MAG: hypothetical protein DA405_10450 [Bacteroidota bacterium]